MAITYSRSTQDFKVDNKKCSIENLNLRFKDALSSELKIIIVSKTTRIPFFSKIPPVHPKKLNYIIATQFCTEFCGVYIEPKELESVIPSSPIEKRKQKKLPLNDKDFDIVPLKNTKPQLKPLRTQKKGSKKKRRNRKRSKRLTKIRKRNYNIKVGMNTDFVLNKYGNWDCLSSDKDWNEYLYEDWDEYSSEDWNKFSNKYDYFDICDYEYG